MEMTLHAVTHGHMQSYTKGARPQMKLLQKVNSWQVKPVQTHLNIKNVQDILLQNIGCQRKLDYNVLQCSS